MASVTKRKGKRGLSFLLRASIGTDADGTTIYKSKTWKAPKGMSEKKAEKEAQRQAEAFEELLRKGINTDKITFREVSEQFIDARRDELKPTTLQNYTDHLKHINQSIGHFEIKSITKAILRDFIEQLKVPYYTLSGIEKRRSAKTISNYYRIISTVMSYACEMDYIENNPCIGKGIKLPKQTDRKEKATPVETIRAYVDVMEEAPLQDKAFFFLALYSGARKGEVLGLSWDNVNFTDQEITIADNCQYLTGKGVLYQTPKSESSARTISLPPEVFDILRQLQTQQKENRLQAGPRWKANPENPGERYCENHIVCNKPCRGFCAKNCKMFKDGNRVFVNELGAPLHPDTSRKNLQKIGARAGLPKITVHQLRHFLVSAAIANGDPITQIAGFVGHSSPKVTNEVYAHEIVRAGQAKHLNTDIGSMLKIAK